MIFIGPFFASTLEIAAQPKKHQMEVLTETVKVIVEKVVGYTIGAVARQMGYLIHFKKNVENLGNKVDDLEDARKSVEHKVKAARMNVEEIDAKVLRWQTRFEGITEEVQKFFKEEGQAKLKCFNLKARYQLGKRAHKMGLAVKELKDTADTFDTVGHRVPVRGGTAISTKGYEDFKSRKSTLKGIMRDLKDDSIRAIGVYGMAGVGKTMLVGKVATQAIKEKLFERIVTLVVSQSPNLKKIQEDIAKELELKFKDDTDFQKAHLLRERLKKEKILLIIDDIWDELDLENLGISFGDDNRGSKLLLTSRSEDVLGKYTDFPKIFQVKPLSYDEAELLFVEIVGNFFDETLGFQSTMVEVVKECAGLPIAITTVANALKSRKDLKIWKDAVVQLKRANPTQIKGMHEKVYSSIKLSYDFLTKEAQSLFLFCSIFEEDKVIEIDLLWRYLVGLDFFEDVYKMEEVRNRVHTLVNTLKDSCLLLEYNASGTFKMHDVIRDVAIYIADKEEKMLTIRSLEGPEKWKDPFGIALFNVDFKELPERFGCPQLKFIFLGGKTYFSQPIPNNVFEGMKELRVLVLIESRLPHPSSISCLDNLQSLVLHACELEDVALIGELKNLRALTLSHSNIMRAIFSKERTHEIQVNHDIRTDIIDFRKLRSLYLQNLPNFMGFHPDVDSQVLFNEKVAFYDLEEICIEGIDNLKMLWHNHQLVPNFFCKIKKLHVGSCKNLKNIFPPNMLRRLQNLEELTIEDCNSVEEVFEVRGENVDEICDKGFTQLRHLTLNNLPKLKYVWTSDPKAILTFQNLRQVEVSKCGILKSLFPISVAKHLVQLESLSINGCELMEEIVALKEGLESTTKFVFPRITSLSLELLLELKCFYPGKYTSEWPSLKELTIRKCSKLKIVAWNELSFPNTDGLGHHVPVQWPLFLIEKDAFPNLKELNLDLNETMNQTNDRLFGDFFCKLEVLRLYGKDDKLIAVPSVVERLRYLKSLSITNLFFDNEGQGRPFERLTELNLYKMPKLMLLWKDNSEQGRAFQNVEILRVSECGRLKNLVQSLMHFRNLNTLGVSKCHGLISFATSSTVKSLVQLKQLIIYECKRMREIVTNEGEAEADEICFSQLKYLSLLDLPSLRSFHLGNRTIKFPSLQDLIVTGCPEMKIFSNGVLSMPKLKEVGLDENEWWPERRELLPEEDVNSAIKRFWVENYDPCVQQLFTEKTDASTSEAGEKNGVDNLEDDLKED